MRIREKLVEQPIAFPYHHRQLTRTPTPSIPHLLPQNLILTNHLLPSILKTPANNTAILISPPGSTWCPSIHVSLGSILRHAPYGLRASGCAPKHIGQRSVRAVVSDFHHDIHTQTLILLAASTVDAPESEAPCGVFELEEVVGRGDIQAVLAAYGRAVQHLVSVLCRALAQNVKVDFVGAAHCCAETGLAG
jgi:hypothetical protein